jgi:hypothetical protein
VERLWEFVIKKPITSSSKHSKCHTAKQWGWCSAAAAVSITYLYNLLKKLCRFGSVLHHLDILVCVLYPAQHKLLVLWATTYTFSLRFDQQVSVWLGVRYMPQARHAAIAGAVI